MITDYATKIEVKTINTNSKGRGEDRVKDDVNDMKSIITNLGTQFSGLKEN